MSESLNVGPLWDMKDWAYMETANKVSFMPSDFTFSDESGPPTKRFKRGMTRDQLNDILDIVKHTSKVLEITETSSMKEFDKKKEGETKVGVEICYGMSSERDCKSKTFDDNPFSRSKDKTDDSGYIGSPEYIEDYINVQESSKTSAETSTATTSGEESTNEVPDNLSHVRSIENVIRTLQRSAPTTDLRLLYQLLPKTTVPNSERLENSRGLDTFRRIKATLDNIDLAEKEINDTIKSMVKTKETAIRLSLRMQQTLNTSGCGPLWDNQSCGSLAYAKPLGLQNDVILKHGSSLLQELNVLKDITHVDITTWESFRKEVKHAKDSINHLPSTSNFIYRDDDIQDVVFCVNKLWKLMYGSSECRKVTDELFSKLNKTIRSLFCFTELSSDAESSTRIKYVSNSPVRKQSVFGSKINLKSSNCI